MSEENTLKIKTLDELYTPEVYSFINVYKAFWCINESITKLKRTSKLNVVKYRRK